MIPISFIYANTFALNSDVFKLESLCVLFHELEHLQIYPYYKGQICFKRNACSFLSMIIDHFRILTAGLDLA